jgi:hypothetical protein
VCLRIDRTRSGVESAAFNAPKQEVQPVH